MKRCVVLTVVCLFSSVCNVRLVSALELLDALLPTPHLLRSRADDLNIDAPTLVRINETYKAAEPHYHKLVGELRQTTQHLDDLLTDPQFNSRFDEEAIAAESAMLLKAENRLKLYQVGVRIALLSQLSAEQRQGARNFASEKLEEARWRGDVLSNGEFDALLPKPGWLRSRAEELGVDTAMRERLEQTYKAMEPKYHNLKQEIQPLTQRLHEVMLADNLDDKAITKRFVALLAVETRLKLYQVSVRASLMSLLSAEQRQAARNLVKRKPDVDWRKLLSEKVERVRILSQQIGDKRELIADIERRMRSIEETISEGLVIEGGRRLDQLIRDLEKHVDDS